jgi:hypothetical protein
VADIQPRGTRTIFIHSLPLHTAQHSQAGGLSVRQPLGGFDPTTFKGRDKDFSPRSGLLSELRQRAHRERAEHSTAQQHSRAEQRTRPASIAATITDSEFAAANDDDEKMKFLGAFLAFLALAQVAFAQFTFPLTSLSVTATDASTGVGVSGVRIRARIASQRTAAGASCLITMCSLASYFFVLIASVRRT